MGKLCIRTGVCCFLLLLTSWVTGQQTTTDDYLELSLEELLKIEVSVASNKSENISRAPAVVSRYNADDMKALGLNTLEEMLSFIPGLVVNSSEIGTTALMIRGLVEGFNQKVLFMLDGVPYWQSSHGDNAMLGIPLEAISHVEVIRGPGAVIYGTNATGGVVNVVTRQDRGRELALGGGSNSLINGAFRYGEEFGNGKQLQLAVALRRDKGYEGFYNARVPPPFYPEDTPLEGSIKRYKEYDSFMASYRDGNFKALFQTVQSGSNGLAAAASIVNEAELKYNGWLFHMNYLKNGQKWNLRFFGDYNNFHLEIPTEALFGGREPGVQEFADHGKDNFRWRGGIHVDRALGERVKLLGGAEYEMRSSGEYGNTPANPNLDRVVTMEPQKRSEVSGFAQLDAEFGSWRLLAGARYTDNEQSGSDITPRGSVIYSFNEEQSIKVLYSVGFNSPNFIQTSLAIPFVVAGDPDLIAEKVDTFDLAYTWARPNTVFVANAYRLSASDLIFREPNPNAPGTIFSNSGDIERHGVELDFQRAWKKGALFANAAWHKEGNQQIDEDLTALFAPRWNLAAGGLVRLGTKHKLGGSVRHTSAREEVDANTLVNMSYTWTSGKLYITLTAKNLLGETVVVPDIGNFRPDRLSPGGDPDASGELELGWRF